LNRGAWIPARLCGKSFTRFAKNIDAKIERDSHHNGANAVGYAKRLLLLLEKVFRPYLQILGKNKLADACAEFGSVVAYKNLAEKVNPVARGTLNRVVYKDMDLSNQGRQIYSANPLAHKRGRSSAGLNIGKTKYGRSTQYYKVYDRKTGKVIIKQGSGCATGKYINKLATEGIRFKPKTRRPKYINADEAAYYNKPSRDRLRKLIQKRLSGKKRVSIVRKYCKPMRDLSGFDPEIYATHREQAGLIRDAGLQNEFAAQLALEKNIRNQRPIEALPSLNRMQIRAQVHPATYKNTLKKGTYVTYPKDKQTGRSMRDPKTGKRIKVYKRRTDGMRQVGDVRPSNFRNAAASLNKYQATLSQGRSNAQRNNYLSQNYGINVAGGAQRASSKSKADYVELE